MTSPFPEGAVTFQIPLCPVSSVLHISPPAQLAVIKKVIVEEMGDAGFLGLEKSIHFVYQVLDSISFAFIISLGWQLGKGGAVRKGRSL